MTVTLYVEDAARSVADLYSWLCLMRNGCREDSYTYKIIQSCALARGRLYRTSHVVGWPTAHAISATL